MRSFFSAKSTFLYFSLLFSLYSCGSDKALRYYNMGVEAAERGDYREAAKMCSLAVLHKPDDADAQYNLGAALFELGRYNEAQEHLRKAASLNPDDYQTLVLLAESLTHQGNLAEAKLAYQSALVKKPNYVPALIGLATIALEENQNRTAEKYATEAVDFDPANARANALLAEAYLRNGQYNEAYAQILTAARLKPLDQDILLLQGKIAYARRMYEDAIEALDTARKRGLSSGELYRYLGLAKLSAGAFLEAERDFKLALFKDDSDATAWKGLAETYMRMKKWSEAKAAIVRSISLEPDNKEALLDSAIIKMSSGELEEAARELETLQNLSTAPKITSYYLGHTYLRMGDERRALLSFERFVSSWEGDRALLEEARSIIDRLSR